MLTSRSAASISGVDVVKGRPAYRLRIEGDPFGGLRNYATPSFVIGSTTLPRGAAADQEFGIGTGFACEHLLMDQDDPEQRIADLERQLANQRRIADLERQLAEAKAAYAAADQR